MDKIAMLETQVLLMQNKLHKLEKQKKGQLQVYQVEEDQGKQES